MIRIAASRWALDVRPERGGRITSLRLDGHELLDQGIGVDQPTADGFVDGGAWGWDEMVPTVEATGTLPDHGEAWRVPWHALDKPTDMVTMRCTGRIVPWELQRTLSLGGGEVLASYLYENIGKEAHRAYWCAHPLFRYAAGMEIDVGARLMGFAEGKSGKFFLPPGSIDRARLRWADGTEIEVAWDSKVTPYCGVWICNGDLGGYRQVAIEPATGGYDRPDSDEPPPLLQPGETLDWWLRIRPL